MLGFPCTQRHRVTERGAQREHFVPRLLSPQRLQQLPENTTTGPPSLELAPRRPTTVSRTVDKGGLSSPPTKSTPDPPSPFALPPPAPEPPARASGIDCVAPHCVDSHHPQMRRRCTSQQEWRDAVALAATPDEEALRAHHAAARELPRKPPGTRRTVSRRPRCVEALGLGGKKWFNVINLDIARRVAMAEKLTDTHDP